MVIFFSTSLREGAERIRMTQNTKDLPYEKFMSLGPSALTEAELLAIILRTGTKNCPALELAEKVLSLPGKSRGLNLLHHISLRELMEVPGIGEVKAVKVKCIAELAMRMSQERAADAVCFNAPHTVAEYYMERLRHKEKEIVLLLHLDNKLKLIEEYILSMGTAKASLISSREIFIQALKCRACNLMLLHNHPSGDPHPSSADVEITKKIKEAGELMDIPLIDHIVVGDGCYISFKEEHLL